MNGLRKLLTLVLAVFIAYPLLSGTAHAQVEKLYGLKVTASGAITSPTGEITLQATFKNLSPKNANSSFNSLRLVAPDGVEITEVIGPTPTSWNGGLIRYENLNPVGKDASFVVNFKARITTLSCTLVWNPDPPIDDVWTGSQIGSGNPFTKVVSANFPSTTTLTGAPDVALNTGTATGTVLAGSPGYAMTATVIGGCGSPIAGAEVTLSGNNYTATPAGPYSTDAQGVASFTVVFGATGSATVTASALGDSDSRSFAVFENGNLGCTLADGTLDTNNPSIDPGNTLGTPGNAMGRRHDNKDGSPCIKVEYTFVNDILSGNLVSLAWNTTSQPNAVFDYTVFWRPEFVDPATGLPKRRTKVAWEPGPLWVWANACTSRNPPAVYTTLAAAITDTAGTSITVSSPTGTPLAVPFAVVIGTERLTVTSVGSGTNWTVIRGGTNGTLASTHASGAKVMTTPLPIDPNATKPGGGPNPYYLKQARMCIWDEEFQSWAPAGTNLFDCSPSSPGYNATSPTACVIRRTSVFDIGDGFMSLD